MRWRVGRLAALVGAAALLLTVVPPPAGAAGTIPPTFADPAFQAVWQRYDRPVADGAAVRSWTWGGDVTGALQEPFREGPGGRHLVQYFDKSRMELNDPNGDRSNPFFVTQGLLAEDMIRGRVQVGTDSFEPRPPAAIPFGDEDDRAGPTYASLARLLAVPPLPVGTPVTASLDRGGAVGAVADSQGVTSAGEVPGSGHSLASVFRDYLSQSGTVYEGGQPATATLYDPTFYVTGLPITEAYWARLKAAGALKTVLLQCFERRCLTYTPTNAPAWRVEQGNTGLQYYRWRYPTAPAPPAADLIAFTSQREGSAKVWLMAPDGSGQRRVTATDGEETDPSWAPDRTRLALVHDGFIYTLGVDGSGVRRLVGAGRYESRGDLQPAWSPDGAKLAFTRCRDALCNSEIWVMNADGGGAIRVIAAGSEPRWSPDGKQLLYASSLGVDPGQRQLYLANADGTGVAALTGAGPGYMPAWAPDGRRVAFASNRGGRYAVYTARRDGSGVTRLTGSGGDDYAPSWSPDGTRLAFASTRDRTPAIPWAAAVYVMADDGSGQARLTDPTGSNAMPHWYR